MNGGFLIYKNKDIYVTNLRKVLFNNDLVSRSVPFITHDYKVKFFLLSLLQFRVVGCGVVIILQHDTLSFQTTALQTHQ